MVKRKRIALIFSYNSNWIGGAYYILNLIHALNRLPDVEKPHLTVISTSSEDFKVVEDINYPYISFFLERQRKRRLLSRIIYFLFGKSMMNRKSDVDNIDIIFPLQHLLHDYHHVPHKLYWIPDLQEHFLPHMFKKKMVKKRYELRKKMAQDAISIIFSSQAAKNDFKQIYREVKCNFKVLNFAVTHPNYKHISGKDIKQKYNLLTPYFMVPNQFWKHKNHITVLKAMKHLKKTFSAIKFKIIFTGKEYDFRNPEYTTSLKQYVRDYQLEYECKFLGFIDRSDQLALMREAIAIIQPSLFEGWSTVVEDAKAMGQYVIASNLQVHQEQLKDNASFFNPVDYVELASIMEKLLSKKDKSKKSNYDSKIIDFGKNFMDIVNKELTKE